MPKYRINIFYVISLICTFILIGYIWFIFLPQFEGTMEYQAIKTIVLFIIFLLFISIGIQLFLLKTQQKSEKSNDLNSK